MALCVVAGALLFGLIALDWTGRGDAAAAGLAPLRIGVSVVAALALLAILQTAMRRAATGGIAAHVALTAISPLVVLVGGGVALASGDAGRLGAGAVVGLVGVAAVFGIAVAALRDESRGLRPDPGASVLEMPPVGDRTASTDG